MMIILEHPAENLDKTIAKPTSKINLEARITEQSPITNDHNGGT